MDLKVDALEQDLDDADWSVDRAWAELTSEQKATIEDEDDADWPANALICET